MRLLRGAIGCTLFLISGVLGTTAFAADRNGYTAQFECRAGGAHCNVDVAALAARTCDQILSPSESDWRVNWSNDTICLAPGDHTHKGTLTIPASASGSVSHYKVLRYYSANDDRREPWKQASQAKIQRLVFDGADYWLVDRLVWPATTASTATRIDLQGGNSNIILNRILVEGSGFERVPYSAIGSNNCSHPINNFTLQNSVIRRFYGAPGVPAVGVSLPCAGSNVRVVNNELYDWSEHPIQVGRNENPTMPGFVVENNDIYNSPDMLTQNGTKSRAQSLLVAKADGTSSAPARIIQNRIWGGRFADSSVCCDWGAPGRGIIVNGGNGQSLEYILVQNNIVFDSQQGFAAVVGLGEPNARRNSIVGNLFYDIRPFCSGSNCEWDAIEIGDMTGAEVYLNTVISAGPYSITDEGEPDNDLRCNVFIDSGGRRGGGTPGSYQADHNVFYGSPVIAFNGSGSYISHALKARQNATAYQPGNVVRLGDKSQCRNESDSACFLYAAVQGGVSGSSSPHTCSQLGCTFDDGSVVWQAVRGPYVFWRKLQTSPERVIVPYARPHSSADENRACPSDFASRPGIGINDAGL